MISTAVRRAYIEERINTDWGYTNFEKQPNGFSLADILHSLQRAFGRDQVPKNTMSIHRDIERLRDQASLPDEDMLSEAQKLLAPERFPEWRAKFFKVSQTGDDFQTPKFQHAIFWVMHAATFKVRLPGWVIEYLDELDPKHPFPEDLNEIISGDKKSFLSFLLLMAPRHGKTELMVHFVLHTFALDPNKRVMFGNGTQKKSEGFIDNSIMAMMEGLDPISEEFVQMYGPFKHDQRPWSKMGFTLAGRTIMNTMYSLQPFGISGNIRSFNADAILGDDLADLNRSRSEATTDADYAWLTTELMMRREYHTSLILTGSHVAVQTGDIFSRLLNNLDKLNVGRSRFIIKAIPAHFYTKCNIKADPDHEECTLWPEGDRDYGFLESKRAELDDDAMFEAVFNQTPMTRKMMHFPEINLRSEYINVKFDREKNVTPQPKPVDGSVLGVLDDTRSWMDHPTCCNVPTFMTLGFDPAASEAKGSSFSALSVRAGCSKCGRRFAVDWWKDRQSPEMHPDTIGTYTDSYPMVSVVNVEINAYQRSLSRDPRMQELEAKGTFVIKEWNTDERKHDPRMGIPVLGRKVKSGLYSVPHKTLADQEFAETILKEFIRWPQKPNDFVMADWLAELALAELIEDAKYVDHQLMPGSEKWMSEWHEEQTWEVNLADIQPSDGIF